MTGARVAVVLHFMYFLLIVFILSMSFPDNIIRIFNSIGIFVLHVIPARASQAGLRSKKKGLVLNKVNFPFSTLPPFVAFSGLWEREGARGDFSTFVTPP